MELDGRIFHGVTEAMTAVQDDYIMTQLRRSGATETLVGLADKSLEERLARSVEMFDRIVESGRKYKLLAGMLIEEGKTWNQPDAEKNAERFAAITDNDQKMRMNSDLIRYIQFFFRPANPLSATSQNSSTPTVEAQGIENVEAATLETSPLSSG